ncbi:MAG: hypothetical protein AB4063_04050 [Crocosphaera sp.]
MGKSRFLKEVKKLNKNKINGYNIHEVVAGTLINPQQVTGIPIGMKGIKSLMDANEYFYRKYGRGAVIFVPLNNDMFTVGFIKSDDFRETQSASLSLVKGYNPLSEIVASVDPSLSVSSVNEWGTFQVHLTVIKKTDPYCTQIVF